MFIVLTSFKRQERSFKPADMGSLCCSRPKFLHAIQADCYADSVLGRIPARKKGDSLSLLKYRRFGI